MNPIISTRFASFLVSFEKTGARDPKGRALYEKVRLQKGVGLNWGKSRFG